MITMEQKRKALKEITDANDGKLTAELVVEAARDKGHVLHVLFIWDEAAAARAHWLDIAGDLIRQVKIEWTVENRVVNAVAYVRDPDLPDNEAGHIALTAVEHKSASAMAIVSAELEMRIIPAIERAQGLADYLGLRRDFDALLANAVALRTKMRPEKKKRNVTGKVKPRDIAARVAARRDAGPAKPRHA